MVDFLLINTPPITGKKIEEYVLPLGVGYIAAALEKEGYSVEVLDNNSWEKWEKTPAIIEKTDAEVVGISCMTTNYPHSIPLAKLVKERGLKLVYGGPHPSATPEKIIKSTGADVVVRGEGEETIIDVMHAFEGKKKFSDIAGISYNENGIVKSTGFRPGPNLDSLPIPAYHHFNLKEFDTYLESKEGHIPVHPIMASRGCIFNCIFCYTWIYGKHWRGRTPSKVCDEIEFLQSIDKRKGVWFKDPLFCAKEEFVVSICKEIIKRGLDIKWAADGRIDLVATFSEDTMRLMAKSGCIQLDYGMETLNNKILQNIKSGFVTREMTEKVVKKTTNAGIVSKLFFMIGLPGDTVEDARNTTEILLKWIDKYLAFPGNPQPTMVFPGTRLETLYGGLENHDWIKPINAKFVFPNVPIYDKEIPLDILISLGEELGKKIRAKLIEKWGMPEPYYIKYSEEGKQYEN